MHCSAVCCSMMGPIMGPQPGANVKPCGTSDFIRNVQREIWPEWFHCRNTVSSSVHRASKVSSRITEYHRVSQSGTEWHSSSQMEHPSSHCDDLLEFFWSRAIWVALPVSWTRTSSGIPDPVTLRSLLTASSSCAKPSRVRCWDSRFLDQQLLFSRWYYSSMRLGLSQGLSRTEACAPADPLRPIIHRQGERGEDSNLEVGWDWRNQQVCCSMLQWLLMCFSTL